MHGRRGDVGKTHLVIALGLKAVLGGKEVRFFQTVDLANRLLEKNAKGTLGSFIRDLESCDHHHHWMNLASCPYTVTQLSFCSR